MHAKQHTTHQLPFLCPAHLTEWPRALVPEHAPACKPRHPACVWAVVARVLRATIIWRVFGPLWAAASICRGAARDLCHRLRRTLIRLHRHCCVHAVRAAACRLPAVLAQAPRIMAAGCTSGAGHTVCALDGLPWRVSRGVTPAPWDSLGGRHWEHGRLTAVEALRRNDVVAGNGACIIPIARCTKVSASQR